MMLKNFRTYHLALNFYKECEQIKSRAHIRDQLQRSALSVVLNLAEGSAKPTTKDRKKYYAISLGSFRESQALLEILGKKKELQESDMLGSCLYKLVHS